MSRGIPRVREWKLRTANQNYRVNAPTRRLALLNFRGEGYWSGVLSIAPARKPIGFRGMVEAWRNPPPTGICVCTQCDTSDDGTFGDIDDIGTTDKHRYRR